MRQDNPQINSMNKVRKQEIIVIAEGLSEAYSSPPIPVLEIAERNGIDVVFNDLPGFSETVAGFVDFKTSKMLVNDALNVSQKAFTMAHELGHWMLHKKLFEEKPEEYAIMPRFQKPDLTSKYEVEANLFASRILMPARLIDGVKKHPASRLANIFMVTVEDMESRLKDD